MLVICTPPAVAAPLEQPTASNQIWVDLNPSHNANPNLQAFGDIGVRWETTRSGWQHEGLFFDSSKSVDVIYFRLRLFRGLGQLLRIY